MNAPKPFHEDRPWGQEVWLMRDTEAAPSMVKIITVNPGAALSLQYHHGREEFWTVVSGDGTAEIDGKKIPLSEGASCFIPRNSTHRVTGGARTLVFVELAFGAFDESDIVRLEDRYGRAAH